MARFNVIAQLMRRVEELERRHANQQREGVITDVDHDKGLVKVSDGVWSSQWLKWHEQNGEGGLKTRTMPKKGSTAIVKAVSGNLEEGTVTFGAYKDKDNKLPDAKEGQHVSQWGADDASKGKQVKSIVDESGNRSVSSTDSDTKTVGKYSHTMTKDGGHVLTAGGTPGENPGDPVKDPDYTYKMTADGGHEMSTKGGHSWKMDSSGHTLTSGGQTFKLTPAGIQMDAPTAFSKDYGVGSSPGAITKIDNAIDMT